MGNKNESVDVFAFRYLLLKKPKIMFYQRASLSVLLSVRIFFNDLNIVFHCNTINNYNSSYVKNPIIQ